VGRPAGWPDAGRLVAGSVVAGRVPGRIGRRGGGAPRIQGAAGVVPTTRCHRRIDHRETPVAVRRDRADAGRTCPSRQQEPAPAVDLGSFAVVPDNGDGAAEGVTVEHEDRLSTECLVTFRM
jgi:hypothetical protein